MPLNKKHTSIAYIDLPEPRLLRDETTPPKPPPMPRWNCFDIPSSTIYKPSKWPAIPKPPCSITITPPTINFPPIQHPPMSPIQMAIDYNVPAGSCQMYDTVERESNTVSSTVSGKTTVLSSEGYEKRSKYMTRRDNTGLSHTYCKESETKNNVVKGSVIPEQQFQQLGSTSAKPRTSASVRPGGKERTEEADDDFGRTKSIWERKK